MDPCHFVKSNDSLKAFNYYFTVSFPEAENYLCSEELAAIDLLKRPI